MLYRFQVAGRKLPLFKRKGESFEHVMLKALCYGLHAERFERLEVERPMGGRYTPDVVSVEEDGRVLFWGECGQVSLRKAAWLAKHSGAAEIAFVKLGANEGFLWELRKAVDPRYRPAGRVRLYAFSPETTDRVKALDLRLDAIPRSWYRLSDV